MSPTALTQAGTPVSVSIAPLDTSPSTIELPPDKDGLVSLQDVFAAAGMTVADDQLILAEGVPASLDTRVAPGTKVVIGHKIANG